MLLGTALVFVFICGANDGGALLALATRHRARSNPLVLLVLVVAVGIGPALFGLAVARTFTHRLLAGAGDNAQTAFLVAAAVAIVIVLTLTWKGIPTSITLALLGALAGATAGFGTRPAWGHLGFILLLGILAPLVGLAVAYLLGSLVRRLPVLPRISRLTGGVQLLAFAGQSLAYAANDGQKMFAVVIMAAAALGHPLLGGFQVGPAIAVAAVFAAGSALSLRRVSLGATTGLLRARPGHVISAEIASSVAVFGSAGVGVPVSITQSTTGGLVGAALMDGHHRVRWQYAVPLVVAWVVTLPAGLAGGALAAVLVEGLL
ncbi:inorganic phosphate transporter [Kribbella deserti]|uniref:Inorganic phosphate transporter n=1 Tax=Kribbella deserti TaxID=1926257 RepID=A0ABV6QH93_9ACTN